MRWWLCTCRCKGCSYMDFLKTVYCCPSLWCDIMIGTPWERYKLFSKPVYIYILSLQALFCVFTTLKTWICYRKFLSPLRFISCSVFKSQRFTYVLILSPFSIPAAYIQFPGLWDCETGSSPCPLPPWRFLHGLQHRARLLWRWLNDAEQLQMFVVLISIHTHTSLWFLWKWIWSTR